MKQRKLVWISFGIYQENCGKLGYMLGYGLESTSN